MRTGGSGTPDGRPDRDDIEDEDEAEEVERRLASYVFVREERDREVRMLFRDVPAPDIASAFRAAGATLISITGERVNLPGQAAGASESTDLMPSQGGRKRRKNAPHAVPTGEPFVLYFFGLRETVYTVSIALPTGVGESIAGIYPGARLAEGEVEHRLGMVFRHGAI